jgi:glycine cleavage system T protein (aminomethyltransferase)
MKQTVLHQKQLRLKAKMTDFQGWQVPLQFSSSQDEYHAVRAAAGLFDISFLGRIEVSGPGALPLLQRATTRDLTRLAEGTAHYGLVCNDGGGLLDDVVIFCLPGDGANGRYLITTNAANTAKMLQWLGERATSDMLISDKTDAFAQFSLQGPLSFNILEKLATGRVRKSRPRSVKEITILDAPVLVARTGYTGEHGYEFIFPADRAEPFWDAILAAGSDQGLLACGLACRDILRLEMGYVLYGNDIDEARSPFEAGLDRFIDFNKEFIGKDALLKIRDAGVQRKLTGFVLLDKGMPKNGGSIFSENHEIGVVTSAGQSPKLRTGIGLGYIITRYSQPGQEIEIEVKDREISAKTVALPFYSKKK